MGALRGLNLVGYPFRSLSSPAKERAASVQGDSCARPVTRVVRTEKSKRRRQTFTIGDKGESTRFSILNKEGSLDWHLSLPDGASSTTTRGGGRPALLFQQRVNLFAEFCLEALGAIVA